METTYTPVFEVGRTLMTAARTIGECDINLFAGLTGDFTPLHVDDPYAKSSVYQGRIAHGLLVTSVAMGLLAQLNVLGKQVLALRAAECEYRKPVFIGDTISARVTPLEVRRSSRGDSLVVRLQFDVRNQNDVSVQTALFTVLMKISSETAD